MATTTGDLSFPKSERLLKNPEFVRVQKHGKRFYSKHFILVVANNLDKYPGKQSNSPGNKSAPAKIGITITNKTEPSAVKRNRVKRMIREAFRQIKGKCISGIAILVIAKSGAIELDTVEVKRQLFGSLNYHGFTKQGN